MASIEQGEQGSIEQKLENLVTEFHEHVEGNKPLLHRQELDDLFRILRDHKAAVSQLPQDKKDDLAALLPKIGDALELCKTPSSEEEDKKKTAKKMMKKKKPALKMGDCYPFRTTDHKDDAADDGEPPSVVAPLLEQTRAILGDSPAPATAAAGKEEEVYYEWTTSYVDKERLYGWDDEAKDVADALAGPEQDDDPDAPLFRAAGIFGIHGSGKTALAQKVFIHDRIKDTFPLRLWVCVGPLEHEDKAGLLYRMLDNLGLDTYKVEEVVNNSEAVKKHGGDGKSKAAEASKIGVLLFILHVTLAKTSYLIVFDDIRASYDNRAYDEWYTNLALPPPTDGGEWNDRLAYGLPKTKKKSAVLVTCRKEEHARAMVRTGRVFHPPLLEVADAWKLFDREYVETKKKQLQGGGGTGGGEYNTQRDRLYNVLKEMQKEIVGKCLGLPVAIVEAAKGFAQCEYDSSDDDDDKPQAAAAAAAKDADAGEDQEL